MRREGRPLAVGVSIGLVVGMIALLAACEGRPRSSFALGNSGDERRTGPTLAILDLSDSLPEQASAGLLGLSAKAATLQDMIGEVERLERATDVRGVLVRFGTARIGLARAAEAAAMLAELRAKWPVWCHADDLGNATLYLTARGCTRIWVSPASSVDAVGLVAQTIYFHKLLADELGLSVDFLQVGKFKGAEEPFTRDGPSAEARQSLESTLADLRGAWKDGIRAGRVHAPESGAEEGPYAGPEAKERGLIDDVGYFDDAREALEKATGAVRAEVRLGPGASLAGGDDLGDLLRAAVGESFESAPIVVVPAVGAISMDGGGGLLGDSGGIAAHKLLHVLSRLEKDDDVKAVVLRIDSPGGSALASDLLWHELMRVRARKVLVVSIGDMAASGGYYLASTGAAVFAGEMSIVGSIGVVGGKIAGDRALEKIGVHAETFPARSGDTGASSRAAYESLLMPWDDATRARVLATMTNVYQLFLTRVSEGRGMPVERVAESAEGRIFSGRDGKTRGLVDAMGGLREAIARARALAGLPGDARVGLANEPGGLLQAFASDDGAGDARSDLLRTAWAEAVSGEAARGGGGWGTLVGSFMASLAPLAGQERVLCALPFALTVR
jgi:protease-4